MSLLLNKQDVDMNSQEVYQAESAYFFDFDYIDDTVLEANAYIMVDADMIKLSSPAMKEISIYVQIVCSKQFVDLDFVGVKGNRRDNLAREIDLLLRGSRDFGIGKLELVSAITSPVPKKFTSKLLTFRAVNFANGKELTSNKQD